RRGGGREALVGKPDFQQATGQRTDARHAGAACAFDPHPAHVIDVSRRGVDQDQALDQLRMRSRKVLRDQPAERDPGDMRATHALASEELRQLVGEIADFVGLVWDRRLGVAWKVVAEQAEACLETGRGNVPQAVVYAKAMQEYERGA